MMMCLYVLIILMIVSINATTMTNNHPNTVNQNQHNNKDLRKKKLALVTLISGGNNGFVAGGIALGQSIVDTMGSHVHNRHVNARSSMIYENNDSEGAESNIDNKAIEEIESKEIDINGDFIKQKQNISNKVIDMIALVTKDVDEGMINSLERMWTIRYVDKILCNTSQLSTPIFTAEKTESWQVTCTKFAAWSLVDYDRIVFMDADTLVLGNIERMFYGYSHASLLAAPDVFPPDTFNSGVLVLTPSISTFELLKSLNSAIGSIDGGDQSIFNRGLCPRWNVVGLDDANCGRLPSIYNANAATLAVYQEMQRMSGGPQPLIAHFMGDIKPWSVLALEYQASSPGFEMPAILTNKLSSQVEIQLKWRDAYYRGSQQKPVESKLLLQLLQDKPNTNNRDDNQASSDSPKDSVINKKLKSATSRRSKKYPSR